jgi:CubicO group peptidase (beta-lactamase class C family)
VLLGDPVSAYLPELARFRVQHDLGNGRFEMRPSTRVPTIQDLLRHTSGLTYKDRGATPAHASYPGSSLSAAAKLSRAEFLAALADAPLLFEPGTDWEYGFSTDVLGHIVERVTGTTLGAALASTVFAPLGLTDTRFDLAPEQAPRYARAFEADPLTGAPQSVFHASGHAAHWESGGGGLVSTARDYLLFAEMLARRGSLEGQRILGRKTVEWMLSDHLRADLGGRIADAMDPAAAGYGFGLGLAVRRGSGHAAMPGSPGDAYWSGVYGTYFWIDPAEQLSAVFMAAVPGQLRMRYRQLVRGLVYQALD